MPERKLIIEIDIDDGASNEMPLHNSLVLWRIWIKIRLHPQNLQNPSIRSYPSCQQVPQEGGRNVYPANLKILLFHSIRRNQYMPRTLMCSLYLYNSIFLYSLFHLLTCYSHINISSTSSRSMQISYCLLISIVFYKEELTM